MPCPIDMVSVILGDRGARLSGCGEDFMGEIGASVAQISPVNLRPSTPSACESPRIGKSTRQRVKKISLNQQDSRNISWLFLIRQLLALVGYARS